GPARIPARIVALRGDRRRHRAVLAERPLDPRPALVVAGGDELAGAVPARLVTAHLAVHPFAELALAAVGPEDPHGAGGGADGLCAPGHHRRGAAGRPCPRRAVVIGAGDRFGPAVGPEIDEPRGPRRRDEGVGEIAAERGSDDGLAGAAP